MISSTLAMPYAPWTPTSAAAAAEMALDVTAVQWPLSVWIARHPWPALEHLSFLEAMRRLQALGGVRLYPSWRLLQDAKSRGEIDPNALQDRMDQYLDHYVPATLRAAFARIQPRLTLEQAELPISAEAAALAARTAARVDLPHDALRFPLPSDEARTRVDALTSRYLRLYLDRGQSAWAMPGRDEGLFAAARALLMRDPALSKAERRRVEELPRDPDEVLAFGLDRFRAAPRFAADYFRVHHLRMPGFVGALRYRDREEGGQGRLMREYLALRILIEWAVAGPDGVFAPHPDWTGLAQAAAHVADVEGELADDLVLAVHRYMTADRYAVWLEAWEQTLDAQLVRSGAAPSRTQEADAQLLFCIDVRSERLRRHLEALGPYATYGCAGFFNLPVRTQPLDSAYAHPSCPAIVTPVADMRERAMEPSAYDRRLRVTGALRAVGLSFKKLKQASVASLALPELSGGYLALHALVQSVPRASARLRGLLRDSLPLVQTRWELAGEAHRSADPRNSALGGTAQLFASAAADLFRSIGLTEFARMVVVCGHEARVENQPHRAAFECGACGGQSGRHNARLLAMALNRADVRRLLRDQHGLHIPDETVFLAAVHITTTDEIEWVEVPKMPAQTERLWQQLDTNLRRAGACAAAERLEQLPGAEGRPDQREVVRRACDWSEIRPEWGLARNRAFWVGRLPDLDERLRGQVFAHDYDWRCDPDGAYLRAIVSGPVTVAQWINLQYYASAVAPHVHGGGNKVLQTVTAGVGVMNGNASDLLPGLPWQSIAADDGHLYHRPLRLTVVMEVPVAHAALLLRDHADFRQKVQNGWLRLWVRDTQSKKWWSATEVLRNAQG
ncbi:putative inorganic carbon transporter subunit DabA [Alicyclobacillus mali (ex Roth et al. 2021)]|uniref:putative inorganic carbon transporter subunit DabA n=1 Tax=Alicyclobacillus mali (ex Roth et al. 2021) TaxID=1123961 RepID=UPI000A93A5CE|nr:putative inorganic carbon transporter subunit DabA [Alicyclobacillus mali (ex Roth et al. 2021)]